MSELKIDNLAAAIHEANTGHERRAKQQAARERAEKLLRHYLQVAFVRSGAKWDSDNDAEVSELVEALVEAARP